MQAFTLCSISLSFHLLLWTARLEGALGPQLVGLESMVHGEGHLLMLQGHCPVTQQTASPPFDFCFSHLCSGHLDLLPVSYLVINQWNSQELLR